VACCNGANRKPTPKHAFGYLTGGEVGGWGDIVDADTIVGSMMMAF
jgi:hypothetical protein